LRDAFNAAMNCPWFLKPALACSSVMPCGSIAVILAFCCGLREMRAEIAFGSGAGVGVVGVLPSVPVPGVGSGPGVGSVPVVGVEPPVGDVVGDVLEADEATAADFFPDAMRGPFPEFAPSDPLCEPLTRPDFGLVDPLRDPLTLVAAGFGAFEPLFATCTCDFGPLPASAAAGTTIVAVTSETATNSGNG
jgi:hypothetical protein